MPTKIQTVARSVLRQFARVLHPQAVQIVTPFPKTVSLASCRLDAELRKIIELYEPKVVRTGLFRHQAKFLQAFAADGGGDFLITTATGSGKSLCFWAWVLEHLRRDGSATALLCFPTQALMWGQAERMRRMSEPGSLHFPGTSRTPYGGAIRVADQRVGWTIWQGVGSGPTANTDMKEHEKTAAFEAARIRIATLDKAHWSLFSKPVNKDFALRLRCLVLDEAHLFDGVFGANVHYFLKRVYLGSDLVQRARPHLFLASATLSRASEFAASLLSLEAASIHHIEDSTRQRVDLVRVKDVPRLLTKPSKNALSRFVVLLDDAADAVSLKAFLSKGKHLGELVNVIFFSHSKFESKLLALDLDDADPNRKTIIYDADLPPDRRRELEDQLNAPAARGMTVLGTSALELGVDIEGLDACFMDDTPERSANLLQRIGRVGRRDGRPGLVVLRMSSKVHDRETLDAPAVAFQLDRSRTLPIPRHLESLKWRSMLAAFTEWKSELKNKVFQDRFNGAMRRHFGVDPLPSFRKLKAAFNKRYGQLVEMDDPFWVYRGFRAAATEAKIPLRNGDDEIARIDEMAVFRDAHPGAIYLGYDRKLYRVVDYDYDRKFKIAELPKVDDDTVVRKWLKTVQSVRVQPERKRITTRGKWEEDYLFKEEVTTDSLQRPRHGSFQFGTWVFWRRWAGYNEIDLRSGTRREVSLMEATQDFADAKQAGEKHPFLSPLTYPTLGWAWDFGHIEIGNALRTAVFSSIVGDLLQQCLAARVECKPDDLLVHVDNLLGARWLVLDSNPGGSGLAEALLMEHRVTEALDKCGRALEKSATEKLGEINPDLLPLGLESPAQVNQGLLEIVRELRSRWGGRGARR